MSKHVTQAGWDDAVHLTPAMKSDLLSEIPPYQRDARSKGIPMLGRGAIYPVGESEFVIAPFAIPDHYPRGYGLDVGWNRTAAVWGALDRDNDTLYLYAEYVVGRTEPPLHAAGIRAKGDWIPGVIDPAALGRSQVDGEQLMQNYIDLGLDIEKADNSVDAGIDIVWTRLVTGRVKVFSNLLNWLWEFRKYRRDEHGHVVKKDDHGMDASRYLMQPSGIARMKTRVRKQYNPFQGGGQVFTG
jgi:hypothetical protein